MKVKMTTFHKQTPCKVNSDGEVRSNYSLRVLPIFTGLPTRVTISGHFSMSDVVFIKILRLMERTILRN